MNDQSEYAEITFSAVFGTLRGPTVDGGWTVTFNVSDDEKSALFDLAKHSSKVLQIGIVAPND